VDVFDIDIKILSYSRQVSRVMIDAVELFPRSYDGIVRVDLAKNLRSMLRLHKKKKTWQLHYDINDTSRAK
jgi:hypothetical protein